MSHRQRLIITKIVLALVLLIVLGATSALVATEVRWTRTFAAPYPEIAATTDPSTIARGKYLVFGAAGCAYCHLPREQWTVLDGGATPPLTGNHVFRLPFGEFYAPNLTPDPETGIGRLSDRALARILRYGVRPDGRAAFPLMSLHGMSDEDLVAVISYLRSQPAVVSRVPDHRLSRLGKALMAFAIEPAGPDATPPHVSPVGPSVARGEYLATKVASCVECHTDRNPRSGEMVGPKFGGGQRMDLAADARRVAVPPNLTPDPATSPVGRWTEDAFLVRFRQGPLVDGTPMPWGAYARMTDDDTRSIFRYLRTLPPYEHATGPVMQDK
jgi:mono/diheme cytochrome c family protein